MNLFRNICRALAVTATAGFLMAVSCDPIVIPTPGPDPQDTTGTVTPIDTTGGVVTPTVPTTLIDTTYAIGVSGATLTMTLTSSGDWSASVTGTDVDWCTVSPQSGGKGEVTVTVSIDANKTYDPRSATVVLKAGESTGRIGIEQDYLKGFEINLQDYVMPPLGGQIEIDLQTNVDYDCRIEGGEWVTQKSVNPTKGMVDYRHTFEVARNTTGAERACSIVFEGDGLSKTFHVLQHPAYIVLSKKNINFGRDAASEQVEISSNVGFEMVLPTGEWLWKEGDIVAEEGNETVSTLTFNAVENPFPYGREVEVIFKNQDYQICDTLFVSQRFDTYFSVSEKKFSFGPEGGSAEVKVTTNLDYVCSVPEDAGWIREEKNGSTHVFTVEKNATAESRSAQITFNGGQNSETVEISQTGAILQTDNHEAEFDIQGGEVRVKVTHNIPYEVVMPEETWVSKSSPESDEYVFTVAENTTSTARKCDVLFRSAEYGMSETLHISQARCVLFEIPQKQFVVGDAGGMITVRVNSNIEYEYALQGTPDWISEESPLVFRIAANSSSDGREAVLRFVSTAEGISETVTISQKQKDVFSLSAYEFELGPHGGNITIEVSSNVEYNYYIENAPGWITESARKLTFDVDRNIGTTSRQCSIVFSAGTSVQRVTVRQNAPSLTVSPSAVSTFPVEGGTANFTITTNVPYTVEMPGVQWIAKTNSGQDGQLGIEVSANAGDRRESSIVIRSADYNLSRTIAISQEQEDRLTVSPTQFELDPEGGEITVNVTSNIDYSASPRCSWISEVSSESTNLKKVYSVSRNATAEARSGSIAFAGNDLSSIVSVSQAAPVLNISMSEASVPAEGGTVDITVDGNISFTCSAEKNWVSYTANSSGVRLNVAQNNTGTARSCTFTVKNADFSITRTVTVTQAQNNVLNVNKTSYELPCEGGEFTPVVTANVDYTVDVPVSWITYNGSKFTVSANEDTSPRSATITYSGSGLSCTIAVSQAEYREPDPVPLDGRVTKLQTHTEGNGVKIVIMGDAFTETQNLDGTYENMVRKAMEAFFNVEPYTTFRNLFDVYMVNVVSDSDNYSADKSFRRLETQFDGGTHVSGNDKMCKRYALHAIRPEREDWLTVRWESDNLANTEISLGNTLVIVMMNDNEQYAGTCFMGVYGVNDSLLDFTQGNSVAYFSLGKNESDFQALLHHEAGGHGFGYLGDEYCYAGTGTVPQDEIDNDRDWQNNFHAMLNIDFTSDPTQVKWKHFLTDERYNGQGLGVFEGAGGYYEYGVYKSTENSIMCDNGGEFNAPSREMIYKRMHKLAYGKTWTYDYETFVEYDAINRVPATKAFRQPVSRPHTGKSEIIVLGEL